MNLTFHPAWRSFLASYLLFFCLMAMVESIGFLAFLPLLYVMYERYSTVLILTDTVLIYKKRFLSKKQTQIHLSNIQVLPVTQTGFEKLLGIGTISVVDASNNGNIILFHKMLEPHRFNEELFHWHNKLMLNYPTFEQVF